MGNNEADFNRALNQQRAELMVFQKALRVYLLKSRGSNTTWHSGQPCMFWDKGKSQNMTEKRGWCGPARVVLVESKSIVWTTHMAINFV